MRPIVGRGKATPPPNFLIVMLGPQAFSLQNGGGTFLLATPRGESPKSRFHPLCLS